MVSCATALRSTLRLFRFRLRSDTFCIGEFDDELVRLDLDPGDMIVDEDCVRDLGGFVEVIPNSF